MNIRTLGHASAFALVLAAPFAAAVDEHNTVPGLTAAGAPLGLHGVDPVGYVDLGVRIDGTARHTVVHDGVAYYFESRENARTFSARPDAYVPQHGGFCTFGVSVGKKFDGDPRYADIRDGRLYVFLNEEIFRSYQEDPEGVIERADRNWQRIRSTAAIDL